MCAVWHDRSGFVGYNVHREHGNVVMGRQEPQQHDRIGVVQHCLRCDPSNPELRRPTKLVRLDSQLAGNCSGVRSDRFDVVLNPTQRIVCP